MMTGQSEMDLLKILEKARKYCAAEERCKMAVEEKLNSWGVETGDAALIIARLEEDNFLSDRRFARLFAQSKVNQNKWGKVKIELELQNRDIPEIVIREALDQIDDDKYLQNFSMLIKAKEKELNDLEPLIRKQKLITFLTAKGYEFDFTEKHIDL